MVECSSIQVVVVNRTIPFDMEQHFLVATVLVFPGECQSLVLFEGSGCEAEEADPLTNVILIVFDLLKSHSSSSVQVTVLGKFLSVNVFSITLSIYNYLRQSICIRPKRL